MTGDAGGALGSAIGACDRGSPKCAVAAVADVRAEIPISTITMPAINAKITIRVCVATSARSKELFMAVSFEFSSQRMPTAAILENSDNAPKGNTGDGGRPQKFEASQSEKRFEAIVDPNC